VSKRSSYPSFQKKKRESLKKRPINRNYLRGRVSIDDAARNLKKKEHGILPTGDRGGEEKGINVVGGRKSPDLGGDNRSEQASPVAPEGNISKGSSHGFEKRVG